MWRIGKEELKYIEKEIMSGLSGNSIKELEEKFANMFGVNYAIGVNTATSGLHASVAAAGVKMGDEVIVPPLTFAASVTAIMYQGGVPVFVDIDPKTLNIDPKKIEAAITSKTKAIMPVSMYGLSSDIDPIMKIAKKHNLKVIEDNAECFLGKYKGKITGAIADMSVFSFERSKHLTTGQGGMVITNNENLAKMVRKFSFLGYTTLGAKLGTIKAPKEEIRQPGFKRHDILGYNYPMPEIIAAMGLAQLDKADMLIKKRKDIGRIFGEAVKGCSWITPQFTPEGYENTFWTYTFRIDTNKVNWKEFQRTFKEQGGDDFYAAFALIYNEPFMRDYPYKNTGCPNADLIQPQIVQLKTNYGDDKIIEKQAEALRKTIKKLS